MIVYNLFPLLAGPFSRWGHHFDRAAAMGFDWIFVNPVQAVGASGSLYSISDYFRLNPRLLDPAAGESPDEQVRAMIARAREHGLQVMIDLVINHCAIDSPLTREHPDWFVREPDGRIAHPSAVSDDGVVVWKDLARFDHEHARDREGLYRYFARVVEHLISLGFEGFRCDAAYQVPQTLWRRLIGDTKPRHPNVRFAAETLGCTPDQTKETAAAGFDYVFNSSKWWDFDKPWLIEQYNLIRETAPSISFPESHDTPRLCAEVNGNLDALKQRYLFSALFSAAVMMPIGFEFGFRKPLDVVNTQPADWEVDGIDLTPFIGRVNAVKNQYVVFREESPTTILPYHNPRILLMRKTSAHERDGALLILNKDMFHSQELAIDRVRDLIQAGSPLRDVSPEHTLDSIPEPFRYTLRPGQGIVLVGARG